MREKDVPQEQGIAEGLQEVCYAVDENGKYVLSPSIGWEPKNIANGQAWDLLGEQLEEIRQLVLAGKCSQLAFHMTRNQMDVRLLAKYSGFYGWQIKRHLKPSTFVRLQPDKLARYAALFKISVNDLLNMDLVREGSMKRLAGSPDGD